MKEAIKIRIYNNKGIISKIDNKDIKELYIKYNSLLGSMLGEKYLNKIYLDEIIKIDKKLGSSVSKLLSGNLGEVEYISIGLLIREQEGELKRVINKYKIYKEKIIYSSSLKREMINSHNNTKVFNWIDYKDKDKKEGLVSFGDKVTESKMRRFFIYYYKNILKKEIYNYTEIGKEEEMRDEVYNFIYNVVSYIKKYLGGNFENIDIFNLSIKGGYMYFSTKDKSKGIIKIDITLIDSYENFARREEKRNIKEEESNSRERDESLSKYSSEVLMGGIATVGYTRVGKGLYKMVDLVVKTKEGTVEKIKVKPGELPKGKKINLNKKVLKVLSSRGIYLDPAGYFIKAINEAMKSFLSNFSDVTKKITYEEYKKLRIEKGKKVYSEKKFLKIKETILTEYERLNMEYDVYKEKYQKTGKKFLSKEAYFIKNDFQTKFGKLGLGSGIQHMIFLPVFLSSIRQNPQDLATYAQAYSEYQLFEIGSYSALKMLTGIKIGSVKLGKSLLKTSIGRKKSISKGIKVGLRFGGKLPGPLKVVGGVVLGALGGMGAIEGGKKLWKKFDGDKKLWKTIANREDFWEKLGLGSEKSFLIHALTMGTLNDTIDRLGIDDNPIVDAIFDSKVSYEISNNPQEYMKHAIGRNIGKYNEGIDYLSNGLKKKIRKLIMDYNKGKLFIPIRGMSGVSPETIFKSRLKKILNINKDGDIPELQKSIYDFCIYRLNKGFYKKKDVTKDLNELDFIISLQHDSLKIDNFYISKQKEKLKQSYIYINSLIKVYFKNPMDRINLKYLFENIMKKRNVYWGLGKANYDRLIDKPKVTDILNMIVEHKRQYVFITTLEKNLNDYGDYGTGVDWK